jgi:ribosome maturation factor RimP
MEYAPDDLTSAVDQRVAELGFELVDVRKRVSRGRTVLQIRVDREGSAPGSGVTADDCATVSRELETWFDESAMLGDRYVLEVSSPGIERPIRFPRHWERYVGQDVRIRIQGRGRERATIVSVPEEGTVVLRFGAEGEEQAIPLKEVKDATLAVDWSKLDRSLARNASKESQ